jgi:hypothetical protein
MGLCYALPRMSRDCNSLGSQSIIIGPHPQPLSHGAEGKQIYSPLPRGEGLGVRATDRGDGRDGHLYREGCVEDQLFQFQIFSQRVRECGLGGLLGM